jgi:transcription antitermination factor NusG
VYTEPQAVSELVSDGLIMERWYAVQTRSRFEKAVRAELSAWGINQYLATFQDVHQWKDRKKVVEVPLFSGYIFVRLQDIESARLQVLKTNGVVRILGIGGQIEPIPDFEIDSIRQLLASGKQCYPHPFVREGSWVRMRHGPLAGVEGHLIRVKSQTRLVLSIQLLSQSVATEVDAWDVEPIRERRP